MKETLISELEQLCMRLGALPLLLTAYNAVTQQVFLPQT